MVIAAWGLSHSLCVPAALSLTKRGTEEESRERATENFGSERERERLIFGIEFGTGFGGGGSWEPTVVG